MLAQNLLTRALAEAAESTYLVRVGFRTEGAAGGVAKARLAFTAANANRAGAVHGGAIATVLLGAAKLAAASSEREPHVGELETSTAAFAFLDAVRGQEDVVADARVLRRGRDTIHVSADARTAAGAPVATALVAYRLVGAVAVPGSLRASRAAAGVHARAGRLAGSAYMGAGHAQVIDGGGEWGCMLLPLGANEGVRGRVHEGAVLGLVDTCAAIAASGSANERTRGASATVSLSAAWAGALDGDLMAGARLLGRAGATYTCEAEVWSAADALVRASALICYRISSAASAEPSR